MELAKALILVATALAGCSAQTFNFFTIDYVDCQVFGVVSVTDTNLNKGTVCRTVSQETADYICNYFGYGTAIDFGTAADKDAFSGSGKIEAMNLVCTSLGNCSFITPSGCTHTDDLVVQCSQQPLLCGLSEAAIIAIAVVCVFLCLIIPLICICICCGVCYCMGALCFAASTPDYGKL